jgi:hypothetical protein
MTRSKPSSSITQLAFQRKWMLARLDCGSLTTDEEAALMDSLEIVDLHIAATPGKSLPDLVLKLERLKDILWPLKERVPEDCLEHVYLTAVLHDAIRLTVADRSVSDESQSDP